MKKILLSCSIAASLAVSSAFADNTDEVAMTASGEVIAALAIAANATDLTIPTLVVPSAGEGDTSVKVACAADGTATTTYSGNGNPYANGTAGATAVDAGSANVGATLGTSTGVCAQFDVTGQGNYNFEIVPTVDTTAVSGVNANLSVSALNCNAAADGAASTATLAANGQLAIHCGATLVASAGAVAATLTDLDIGDIAVTYD